MSNNQTMNCFSALTPAEHERLAVLMEECAEVIQICGKIMRHGYDSCHPNDIECEKPNRALLEKEIGHVNAATAMMANAKDISHNMVINYRIAKEVEIQKYLHHQ